jgi:hypothetical protein
VIEMDEEIRQFKALAKIAASPDGQILLDLFEARLEDHKNGLLEVTEADFREFQGAAREINELIDLIKTAQEKLDAIEENSLDFQHASKAVG